MIVRRARLIGISTLGLLLQKLPTYPGGHSDTGPLEATDVRGTVSNPLGGHWVIPLLTLTLKIKINPQYTICWTALIRIQDASSPRLPCNNTVKRTSTHFCIMYKK
jgi:hypothetical protein